MRLGTAGVGEYTTEAARVAGPPRQVFPRLPDGQSEQPIPFMHKTARGGEYAAWQTKADNGPVQ